MKKICLIIPSLRHGGAERVMSELANYWSADSNLEVTLLLLTKQKQFYSIDQNVTVIEPQKKYKKNLISIALYRIWVFFYIRKECKKLNPDAVLSFCAVYNNLVLLALLFLPFKKYVSDRSNPYLNIGFLNDWLRNLLYCKADGIIAQTSIAKDVLLKKTGNKNIVVIPNPLRKTVKYPKEEGDNILLNIGRLEPLKNQLELIDIFHQCNMDNWKLKIYGNGTMKSRLENKVNQLMLQDKVFVLDFEKEIDKIYSNADIFAFTSLSEGFPNVLNEAMAHGLACISYDCLVGPSDMITNGKNGYLIPVRDKEKYIEKLKSLMESVILRERMGRDAMLTCEKYKLENIANKYLNFIFHKAPF